ncbi:MAG TPA: hypothetical protein VME46_10195 [Acidimicrobiales bacterium]|nr:hypothetical protein [Acidimicrobiales bacterium]
MPAWVGTSAGPGEVVAERGVGAGWGLFGSHRATHGAASTVAHEPNRLARGAVSRSRPAPAALGNSNWLGWGAAVAEPGLARRAGAGRRAPPPGSTNGPAAARRRERVGRAKAAISGAIVVRGAGGIGAGPGGSGWPEAARARATNRPLRSPDLAAAGCREAVDQRARGELLGGDQVVAPMGGGGVRDSPLPEKRAAAGNGERRPGGDKPPLSEGTAAAALGAASPALGRLARSGPAAGPTGALRRLANGGPEAAHARAARRKLARGVGGAGAPTPVPIGAATGGRPIRAPTAGFAVANGGGRALPGGSSARLDGTASARRARNRRLTASTVRGQDGRSAIAPPRAAGNVRRASSRGASSSGQHASSPAKGRCCVTPKRAGLAGTVVGAPVAGRSTAAPPARVRASSSKFSSEALNAEPCEPPPAAAARGCAPVPLPAHARRNSVVPIGDRDRPPVPPRPSPPLCLPGSGDEGSLAIVLLGLAVLLAACGGGRPVGRLVLTLNRSRAPSRWPLDATSWGTTT